MAVLVFYAAINLGFAYPYESQINESLWLHACFRFNLDSNLSTEGIKPALRENTPQVSKEEPREVRIPVNFTPDSTDKKITVSDSTARFDTTQTFSDSLAALKDTVKIDSMSIDSTARIEYLKYKREDVPYVRYKLNNESDFYAQPNQKTRTISIDSTGKYVDIKEEVSGEKTKILLRLPIDDYIKLRLAMNSEKTWRDLNGKYEYKGSSKELGQLIKDITNFEIPLPSVGVLSIFGKPKISLRIGGAVDIHGAWRNETTQGVTASRLGNTRNEPDFKQQVQINVNGTIGDKLNISADWNTERTFEYQNQLKIKYTGYEDEIIQSIEAGNVSLQTTPLVGGSEALFGVKAQMKLGPLTLTTLASQKKGEVKEVNVNSGSTSQDFTIRAYNYSTNNYFVDTVYASTNPKYNLFYKYYGKPNPEVDPTKRIVDIQVWKSVNGLTIDRSKERRANAYINLPARTANQKYSDSLRADIANPVPGQIETGRFVLLTPDVDYTLHPETGYITFHTQVQDQDVIAVAYRVENGPSKGDDSYYGEFIGGTNTDSTTNDSTLILKLVKPQNLKPQYTQAWRLLLKNIYSIGGRNIKKEGFEFNIKYEIPGQDAVTDLPTPAGTIQLLHAFGLDNYNSSGGATPDNIFDWVPDVTVLPTSGEIIFPTLQPFGKNLPDGIPDSLRYSSVYDTSLVFAQQDKAHDRWSLTGKYSGEASSVYQLGFNVVENSVRVTLNGRELTAGSDYTVDYNIGQLTIRNSQALVPGADLKITYEQNDLFQLASKTLLGARGVFDFSKKTKLGFSILNLNQQTLSDKVRIGEEPLSNTIMGVDFKTQADLPFLTKGLDNIISTKEMSSFNVSGEVAYMNPDPNTMKSTIPDDGGQSIAYIDDFEGAKRTIPIGVSYTSWKDLSAPNKIPSLGNLTPEQMMDYKAKSFWYTITPSDVLVPMIWGTRKKVATADQQVPVLDYVFLPDTPGTYNYHPKLQDPAKTWGGMMKILSSTANDLQAQNIQYIEFWVHISQAPQNTKFYIDLGRISEDVIPNRKLDTEDKNNNGVIDESEDTGIDGMFDAQERAKYGNAKSDPSGDDFALNNGAADQFSQFFSINGTEGNAVLTDIGRIPDTEDLNLNGNIDLVNSYFRYEVSLDTNAATNPYIAGGGDNAGWYLMRIPLKDTMLTVGQPSLSDVEYIRLFETGVSRPVHLRFAEFNLVGNQWQKVLPQDSLMDVSVINIEDNPNYSSPPGVNRERDKTHPNQNVYRNEQSLDLILNQLPAGNSREAVKYLYKPLDVFNYQEMKLFIHGDENTMPGSVADTSGGTYAADVFFRFGADSNNYYEYRQPVKPGWNDVDILFSQLTAVKQSRDSVNVAKTIPVPGQPGHFYSVKGNPSLTRVSFLQVGIKHNNVKNKEQPISGEVWVNELRVIGADNHKGWAYSLATSLKLADLMSVNFNMSQTDPYFHKLSDRFGSRVNTKNWSMSANLDVIKLLPFHMPGSSLKLNYSHSESVGKPLYMPGTDIKVDAAAAIASSTAKDSTGSRLSSTTKSAAQIISESQTVNVSDGWSASNVKFEIPSNKWWIKNTINAVSLGFNYNKTFSRSPTIMENKAWVWNANFNYGVNFSPENYFYPANIPVIGTVLGLLTDYRNTKIYYSPQNIALTINAKRNRNTSINRPRDTSAAIPIVSRDFTTTRGFNFGWKLTDGGLLNLSATYNLNISSSLAYLETTGGTTTGTTTGTNGNAKTNAKQRPESMIWHDIFSGAFFGKPYQYQQSFDLRSNPKLPSLWNINKFFTVTAGYSVNYQWNNNFSQGDLGRGAGFTSRSNVGLNLRLKALTEPLFAESKENNTPAVNEPNISRARQRNFGQNPPQNNVKENGNENKVPGAATDTTGRTLKPDALQDSAAVKEVNKVPLLSKAAYFAKTVVRILLFDYDNISFSFSNNNNISKSGLGGNGTGFGNFWGISFKQNNGPSRLFMLGLSSDPGNRANVPNSTLQDAYTQKNDFEFKTSKPLWEGAKIDLNWKVGWSVNKNTTLQTDANGNMFVSAVTSTGSINRSFFSLPPVFFLSVFNSGIKRVNELYDPKSADPSTSLSHAFVQGFESLPWMSKLPFFQNVSNYIPRPNWTISWDGLEKMFPFKSFAQRVSLDHAYNSNYTEGWYLNPDGKQVVQTQRIDYGFAPLVGLNITFNSLWEGNLTGSVKYSTRSSFDLGVSTQNITETFSKDIGITAGYSKSGFELPIFGIALKNDIEFSFSYTNSQNSTIVYNMTQFKEGGTPQDGSSRITMEPRVKYTISSKVTLAIFYKRSSVQPVGASRIPPTTSNEAGLDVHITIQ